MNFSRTTEPGAIRGLHFQLKPSCEMKLVRCLRGRVFDVAVDIRANSPTFLQWYGVELTPDQCNMIVVPEGFAHGFQALEEDSEIVYLTTHPYTPENESGIRHDDPRIGIEWPMEATDVSDRDKQHPLLDDVYIGIKI